MKLRIKMKRKIFLGTKNEGKIERFKKLLANSGLDLEIFTPQDFGLENIEVEENGKTLAENALIKAKSYFGKVDLPILTNDTGFWVEGGGLVDAPKRMALGGASESELSKEEIAKKLLEFWQGVARRHGGKVEAAWEEVFILLLQDGQVRSSESKREVILTDQIFGEPHLQMPMRALYISKATNKPAIQHTKEEEQLEMEPVTEALVKVISH